MGRPALDIESFGIEPGDWLARHSFVPATLRPAWEAALRGALASVLRHFNDVGAIRRLRLHGDCHAGNLLWTDLGPHFVDFDDCRTGPAVQDMWMLVSDDAIHQARRFGYLLEGYEMFAKFDRRELALVEPLRTLRLIHYSAWLARRWDDPAFPAAFPWFNTERYWQDRIAELKEQIGLMEDPLLPAS